MQGSNYPRSYGGSGSAAYGRVQNSNWLASNILPADND
jgi:hypothetical protein